jgi:hypothetical protein
MDGLEKREPWRRVIISIIWHCTKQDTKAECKKVMETYHVSSAAGATSTTAPEWPAKMLFSSIIKSWLPAPYGIFCLHFSGVRNPTWAVTEGYWWIAAEFLFSYRSPADRL